MTRWPDEHLFAMIVAACALVIAVIVFASSAS
jgi:hypothetical protein